jgi:hypothetical protein
MTTGMYTQGELILFLEKVFGSYQTTGTGVNVNYNFLCPVCSLNKGTSYEKKKLAIKTVENAHLAKCWVCGYKSKNLIDLLQRFKKQHVSEYVKNFLNSEEILISEVKEEEKISKVVLPEDIQLLATANRQEEAVRHSIAYLKARGISKSELEKHLWYWRFSISDDPRYRNRIIFPSFDALGELNYYTARSISRFTKTKYVNPPVNRSHIIFNEIAIDWHKPLMLVEGPFDLIKCPENTTCLLGSEFTRDHKLFQNIVNNRTPVILALDPDAQVKQDRIAKELLSWNISVRAVTIPKEFKDIGEMKKEQVLAMVALAYEVGFEDLLRNKIARII